MDSLSIINTQLPETISELAKFVLVGREKLIAVRAEIRAIDKVNLAREVRAQKLSEAQDIAEAVLDAEVRLGELLSRIPKRQGKRSDLKLLPSSGERLCKQEVIRDAGFSTTQAERFEKLAKHPDVVEQMKITAREQDDIINRTAVLQAISSNKKAYIVNNTHDAEWFSPEFIIEGARNVMGTIDLDPCSCAAANERVKATEYYCKENDALDHEWFGTVFLNPPYTGVGKFINKLLESNIDQAVILVNNATETQWFKKLMEKASAIVFLTGRLHFIRSDDHTAGAPMQGQAVIYIGENYDVFYTEFVKYGWGALLNNTEHKRYDMFPSKEEDIYD